MIEDLADTRRKRAAEQLIGLTEDEVVSWRQHPITMYLIKALEADKLDIMAAWDNGQFVAETDSGTIQKNAKALGMSETIDLVLDAIKSESALTEEEFEDDYPDGS